MNVLEKILEEIEEATFQEDAPIYIGKKEKSSCKEHIMSRFMKVE